MPLRRPPFCARNGPSARPHVGWTWDGIAARSLRPHLFFAPRCICVPLDRSSVSGCAVLSVAKLALGQEAYYEQQVALGLDDYYAGRGESPGLWVGSGARGDRAGRHGRGGRAQRPALRAEPRRRRAPARAGEGAHDHRPRARRGDRRLARRAEDPRAGRRLRPGLLVPEERQPPARAHRRRGGAPGDLRSARGELAGRPLLPRGRGVRGAPRPRRRDPRARGGLRRRPPSATAPAAPRTRTCTPT